MKTYSYLALGDSYTIGEQVLPEQNFPNQVATILQGSVAAPDIIAVTGWTTDELKIGIDSAKITSTYDIISLLIGVNNQYRGRDINNFKTEFEQLLQRAIQFSGNQPGHVFVLSIPDWGITAFAEGRDCSKIAAEIDAYNAVCENMAQQYHTHFINITSSQRADGNKIEFLAADQLHPSAKEYTKWAIQLAQSIKKALNL